MGSQSGAVDVLVIDSVAALTPKAEIEGDMGDSHMGLQARLMSQALRKLTAITKRSNTLVIFINQLRMKIGVVFGNPEVTTGGNALKFYSTIRLEVRRSTLLKNGEDVYGNQIKVKVVKNKIAPPFAKVEFDLLYAEGLSAEADVLDLSVANRLIVKSGSWYSLNDKKIGQGREQARVFLKENPKVFSALREKILAIKGVGKKTETTKH